MNGSVILRRPTLEECEQVRVWRNAPDVLPMLRTATPLTADEQATFYREVVTNSVSNHRYYALEHAETFIGLGGLTYLNRVPGEAEISLLLGPPWRGRGLGAAAVDALLAEAFGPLGLHAVTGECYERNPARAFWARMLERRAPASRSWRWEKHGLAVPA